MSADGLDDAALDRLAVVRVPALLSIATVARLLDCSPRTIRRRITEGHLSPVVEGDRQMIRADELRAYVDGLARLQRSRRRPPRSRASSPFPRL
ncbi:MAG TPA: helix-turn-helix domain-containing protein [Solirubrobacter sp.]